ncbi:penicillin-binding transpeptidase domain-containing protein [Tetragenococcus koreensis]|uniref:penicillin-binding transpeptidase domain-containing protein n=1 Tax=Tetragenococcus koreensis TaxID=290335 RepID=UPI001F37A3BA|nr:penicillin-binding transpeptidase domain-containing protein [Tetragenococcus koreensis]MCF1617265.1 penicillin-binding protein 2 [Tetragenococcus koreensis]MCF1622233.1 penicillin-binding protein 2 [Tetragenococcus koreensis]MCF1627505.1 penicillin-binding protein 2 [Tetragenococcus koreensis]MCF1632541.1 penicillin-binding protein 2 [Tetragenococcus koreensis]MCF1678297.1 penicillin-binding protein 2 [Tetragenococcus koreensis]
MPKKNNHLKNSPKKESEEKNHTYKRSHVPFRLNVLFVVIFILFVALVVQLGNLQIVNSENMETRIKASSVRTIEQSTPRGMIYDSQGEPLVQNNSEAAITFTRGLDMEAQDLLDIAEKLDELVDFDVDDSLTERDLKDFWLADEDHLEAARDRLSEKESNLPESEEYSALVDKVQDDEIDFNNDQMRLATIFQRLNGTQELTTDYIKNSDVSNEEIARVSERATELPGVSTGMDWTRKMVTDENPLQSVIGQVSTQEQGLPAEEEEEYVDKGYSRNDRVGTSYLEKQYESVLQGTKSESEVSIDRNGQIVNQNTVSEGKKGDNLKLSIDSEFQQEVDTIVRDNYQDLIDDGMANYSPGIYAVAMNPKTGEILSLSGYYHETGSSDIDEDAIGTYTKSFTPGSVVKAGTLTAGWKSGAIQGNEVLYDQPIRLAGSNNKASIFNRNGNNNQNVSAQKALEYSSNSYMIQVALKMLGINYNGGTVSIPGVQSQGGVYKQLRDAMAQYGMGVKTGIDLPDEVTGIRTPVDELSDADGQAGNLLDLSFGQFDTYTPMQLAQYVSTVANDGKRVRPHLVTGIYDNDEGGGLGEEKDKIDTEVLNEVDISDENLNTIQKGFHDVANENNAWTTAKGLADAKMDLAAKTGTAEMSVFEDGDEISVDNLNMVSYGPYDDPEIAFAVVIPQIRRSDDRGTPNLKITKEVMDAYYDLYKDN